MRALRRQLGHVLLEVALHVPAAHAEGDPVAEGLAPLLLDPAARAAHRFCNASSAMPSAIPSRRSTLFSVSPERSSVYVSRIERNFLVECPSSRSPSWMTTSYGIG